METLDRVQFLDFLNRSGCTLTAIEWSFTAGFTSSVVDLLTQIPTLVDVDFRERDARLLFKEARVLHGEPPLKYQGAKTILDALHQNPTFLPNVEQLRLELYCQYLPDENILSAITTRARGALRLFNLRIHGRIYGRKFDVPKFLELKNTWSTGLSIFVRDEVDFFCNCPREDCLGALVEGED